MYETSSGSRKDGMSRPAKILVVDDAPFVRELLVDHLTRWGYLTVEAATGVEALAAVETANPDMILLDIDLGPGMNGLEVLRRVRREHSAIGVIMMTGYREPSLARQTTDAGAIACLFKPLELARLATLIADFLASRPETETPDQ
jgi:two-component system response regulator (stage 0 sporulation protein F)